ncbi:MAG: bifunctional ornithine acetyltransferase/N-acetylglutamate synthase [Actinomycetota bacterium]|nr:bifunctional ornithine acetyltransferase/N-acetylglutamate synthase [Actinomycetota bacterium]
MSAERPVPGFFRSRWVEAPAHARELDPTALPAGFRAAGVHAGLKPEGLDVGLLVSDPPETTSAARFTTNARVGAPVTASREAALDRLRAVVANSGGSNTGDGERGLQTARATQALAAELLGIEPEQVGVASTGVIGSELPREPLLAGVRAAAAALGPDSAGLSEAIMTTDQSPKRACLEVTLPGGGTVRLSGQAKGAGMISPRFATMFCFVQTDAALAPESVDLLTGVCVKRSFDRISVDGQLSTSDTVFVQASGASGVAVEAETPDELALGEAMDALMRQLALEIVADGEGSERVGRIVVRGETAMVEPVARAIANSPLVKTALHGGDPNFGRILQAAGMAYSWVANGTPFVVDLEIEGHTVVSGGAAVLELEGDDRRTLERAVGGTEVEYVLTLPGEGGETEVFFSDLGHEYVRINAEYTT